MENIIWEVNGSIGVLFFGVTGLVYYIVKYIE